MTKSDCRYFEKARQTALLSDYKKIHIGCIAVYQNNVIGIGYNCNKTHPIQKFYNRYRKSSSNSLIPKLHAEINCIKSIKHLDEISRLDYLAHALPVWQQSKIWGLEIFITLQTIDMYMNE